MLIPALMFYLLVLQCSVAFFMSIPYTNRWCQWVVERLDQSLGQVQIVRTGALIVFWIIVVMFIQAIMQTRSYYAKENFTTETRNRQLLAQRDSYITGFNLFIYLLLRLAYQNILSTNRLKASEAALTKQATNLQTAYKTLMDEKDKLDSNLKSLKELVNEKEKSFDLDQFLKTNNELKTKLATSNELNADREKEIESLKTNLEALKKQATNAGNDAAATLQMDAYNKLVEENESLKEQLKDLDLKAAGKEGAKKND